MRIADRMDLLGTETAFEMLQRIQDLPEKRREHVISFALGEPDFNTPEHIKRAGIKAIEENYTHYCPSAGLMELREAIAQYAGEIRNINIKPEEVTVLSSAKHTIDFAIETCVNPGEEIIYPNPGYPIYESLARVHGAKAVPAPLLEDLEFNYDTDYMRSLITDKTKMIIINTPQNPTGSMLGPQNLEAIAEMAIQHDLWVLTDEIYCNFVYDGRRFRTIAEIPGMKERTIILDGFSKFFAMTGWRLGYSITNPEIAQHFAQWATNTISCTATFIQKAGIAAMKEDKTTSWDMVREFEERRNLIVELLNGIEGVSCIMPKGAFYVFANVTRACQNLGLRNAKVFQDWLLDKADVAVLCRDYFGHRDPDETQEYVRLSYCVSRDNITEGLQRMKEAVEQSS